MNSIQYPEPFYLKTHQGELSSNLFNCALFSFLKEGVLLQPTNNMKGEDPGLSSVVEGVSIHAERILSPAPFPANYSNLSTACIKKN